MMQATMLVSTMLQVMGDGGLHENFNATCFSHAFFKTYQYVNVVKRVSKYLKYVLIKSAKFNIQECIT
jgi:hypothetical protein